LPYAADEVVGSVRYRTEIALINDGDSPAKFDGSFKAYDVGGEQIASLAGAAVLSRDVAEPLRAVRGGSIATARLAMTCDVPAYAVAALLTADGSRTAIHTPDIEPVTERPSCIIWVRDIDLEEIPMSRGSFFEILRDTSQPGAPPPP